MDYTAEDLQKAIAQAGGAGAFSQADLALAQKDINAGVAIANAKTSFNNARGRAEQYAANYAAEQARLNSGNYLGGAWGDGNTAAKPMVGVNSYMQQGANFSQQQWLDALYNSGIESSFSDADLRIAAQNADFGMGILDLKQKYGQATTDQQRAEINKQAEMMRQQYGYTGGGDGSGYALEPLSPSSFQYEKAPTYAGKYDDLVKQALDAANNRPEFSFDGTAPTYTNRYDTQINQQLDKIVNRTPFSYNPDTDVNYQSYQKAYAREGQRATANALAEAAAMTGGAVSTAAQSAAGQAANYYAAQMTDKIPELSQIAYNQYMGEQQLQQAALSALQGAEQSDYQKFLGDRSQYNTDRSFAMDAYNINNQRAQTALQNAMDVQAEDYGRYRDTLAQYNADRNFAYQNLLDEVNTQTARRQEQRDIANMAAGYGDYRQLAEMGIATDNIPYEREMQRQAQLDALDRAVTGAQWGDYAPMTAQGFDMTNVPYEREFAYNAQQDALDRAFQQQQADRDWSLAQSELSLKQAQAQAEREYNLQKAQEITENYAPVGSLSLSYSASGADVDTGSIKGIYPDGRVTNPDDWNFLESQHGRAALERAGIYNYSGQGSGDRTPFDGTFNDYTLDVLYQTDQGQRDRLR